MPGLGRSLDETEDDGKAVVDPLERLGFEPAGTGTEKGPVGSDDLSDVDDGGFRKACLYCRNEYVAGHLGEADVRSENDSNDGCEPAAIEGVGLNDEYRVGAARRGSDRVGKVCPPDLAARYFHDSCGMERA